MVSHQSQRPATLLSDTYHGQQNPRNNSPECPSLVDPKCSARRSRLDVPKRVPDTLAILTRLITTIENTSPSISLVARGQKIGCCAEYRPPSDFFVCPSASARNLDAAIGLGRSSRCNERAPWPSSNTLLNNSPTNATNKLSRASVNTRLSVQAELTVIHYVHPEK